MDQLGLKNGWTFYRRRRSDALYRPPRNETFGQGGTHVGNPPLPRKIRGNSARSVRAMAIWS
jgi:hypothetical protein